MEQTAVAKASGILMQYQVDWIKDQSAEMQDDVFGKAIGAAFRAGDLSLADMTGADLQPLTVAELREMDRI